MVISCMFYLSIIYLFSYLIVLTSGNENKTLHVFTANIKYGNNDKFILYYNLTTNYSYYLTFRLFEHQQIKFGLYAPTYQYQQNSIEIFNQYNNTSRELYYLFIICFYFILPLNDIDIECKDIRLLKNKESYSHHEYHPSYKPLFVILMYALSILMLLPVIIQHRRRKIALLIERRKQLKRLSMSISPDNPNILSQIVENGKIDLTKLPLQIERISLPSTKTFIDDMDDNDNLTFTVQNRESSIPRCDDESDATVDVCIAHLLNQTPWNSSLTQQPCKSILRKRNSSEIIEEQRIPMITSTHANDDQQTILKPNVLCAKNSFNVNPILNQSGV
ncbi:unnamed protein product [Rotaria sp. Silwood1]|nr:unnamed protein product [Rotaria sp. Silwood1]CAF1444039.1 unnamed protein product [Rotaria sp. Silwood1]CAF3539150.1 unnamed protein product [Rotaria sp. Silwood1]CAF4906853.1 unnamed protein product [Rotaria sp. Silwood1]